jgi:hypothetical protein
MNVRPGMTDLRLAGSAPDVLVSGHVRQGQDQGEP